MQNRNFIREKYYTNKRNRPKAVCEVYSQIATNENLGICSAKLLKLVETKFGEVIRKRD